MLSPKLARLLCTKLDRLLLDAERIEQ